LIKSYDRLTPARKIRATQIIGEYLVALEMKQALNNNNSTRVLNLYTRFGSYIQNKDIEYEILSYYLITNFRIGEYGTALGVLNELDTFEPDLNMSEGWNNSDYESFRQTLQDLVQQTEQEVQFKRVQDIEEDLGDFPNGFLMERAYPNPFNPNTLIPFKLSKAGKVKIEVFDVTGRMVSVLTKQNYQVGSYSVQFNASNLASGMYLVRSEILGHVTTQQITLIK
jgi:hypothetical protein